MNTLLSKTLPLIVGVIAITRIIYSVFWLPPSLTPIILFIFIIAWLLLLLTWRKEPKGFSLNIPATILSGATAIAMMDIGFQADNLHSKILRSAFLVSMVFLWPVTKFVYFGSLATFGTRNTSNNTAEQGAAANP